MSKPRTAWAWTIATFFGCGLAKPGPGTYGSMAAALLWYVIARSVHPLHLVAITLGMALLATLIGIPASTIVARESGRKDPQMVVIDEVAGQWLALALMPATWQYTLLGLLLFRLFDIVKPPPVRQLERLPEGTGIVVDDLGAGIYALIVAAIILHFTHA